VGLLLFVLVTKGLIKHGSYFLRDFYILVGQHVSQWNDQLAIVTNYSAEVCFGFVSHYLYKRGKNQTEQRIYHGYVGKTCTVATEEPSTFIVVILASECYMWQIYWYKLMSKVVDAVDIEVDE